MSRWHRFSHVSRDKLRLILKVLDSSPYSHNMKLFSTDGARRAIPYPGAIDNGKRSADPRLAFCHLHVIGLNSKCMKEAAHCHFWEAFEVSLPSNYRFISNKLLIKILHRFGHLCQQSGKIRSMICYYAIMTRYVFSGTDMPGHNMMLKSLIKQMVCVCQNFIKEHSNICFTSREKYTKILGCCFSG